MVAVTVVIPTRNRSRALRLALRSVLEQRDVELDVIVVDDGSTDDTAVAVSAVGDERVRVVRNPTSVGVSGARNRGLREADGEWVAFCDDDDLWSPHKLAHQLAAGADAETHWVYTGEVLIDDDLTILFAGPPLPPQAVMTALPRSNPLSSGGSNVVVRRALLEEVGGFDEQLRRTEDWDLWLRLARSGSPAWVPAPLVAYRFHGGNRPMDLKDMVTEPRLLAGRYGIPVDIAAMHRRAAWTHLRAGRRGRAARHYVAAVARGDLRSAGRLLVALAHPAVGSDQLFGLLSGTDSAWAEQADVWLASFRAARTADVA